MGLFEHDNEHQYTKRGTSFWTNEGRTKRQCSMKGTFYQKDPTGVVKSLELNLNDQIVFFYENQNLKFLQLNLTVIQDHFYYNQRQKLYQIKLKRNNLLTIIFTDNYHVFVKFYKHFAKYTILNCFQKHYKLIRQIGQGCTSKVYIGQNNFSKQDVALKIFQKKNQAQSKDQKIMIINEILNLERLRKFNLSPLIGVYQTHDCVIIVMKKAQAGNMFNYLQQHSHDYNQQLIKNIMFKLLQSLKQLHAAGFIHKDIKPDNILFNNFNSNSGLFLADFGSSVMKKDAEVSRVSRISSGTIGFIAPQIIKDNIYDQKCDLFSVGSLFYFLFKGEPLFAKKSTYEVYESINDKNIQNKIETIYQSQSSKDLMQKLLKVNPIQRISAFEALSHPFFEKARPQNTVVGQENYSLEQYIQMRVHKFFQ